MLAASNRSWRHLLVTFGKNAKDANNGLVGLAHGRQELGGLLVEFAEIFEIVAAVLASVGLGGGIVVAIASWLGKVWASRILEQDRARYRAGMLEAERQSQQLLEDFRNELQKKTHVHRVQFEA
jgi:hypothetical protein